MLSPQQVLRDLHGFFKSSGNFAIFTAIRRASSRVSSLAADRWREAIGHSIGQRGAVRIGECREVIRIAVRAEVARIVGCRDLIRSLDQEGARRRDPEAAYNLAHKRRRGSQPFRQRHK